MSVVDSWLKPRFVDVLHPKALQMQIGREEFVLLESLDGGRLEGEISQGFDFPGGAVVVGDQLQARRDQIQSNRLPPA